MSDLLRTSWVRDSLGTAVVATAVLAMIACATAGSIMLFASSPAPASAPTTSAPSEKPIAKTQVVKRQKEKPNRSKSRYNPKPYKGPLPNIGQQAPAGVAHPPQETETPPAEPTDDGWGDDRWPDRGDNGGRDGGRDDGRDDDGDHDGGGWWDRR